MKKILKHILPIIIILLLLGACNKPRKNEVIYQFIPGEKAACIDSLKAGLLNTQGLEMLAMYPDSDIIIIHYDRFKTHHESIEKHFIENGYTFNLINKSSLEELK